MGSWGHADTSAVSGVVRFADSIAAGTVTEPDSWASRWLGGWGPGLLVLLVLVAAQLPVAVGATAACREVRVMVHTTQEGGTCQLSGSSAKREQKLVL